MRRITAASPGLGTEVVPARLLSVVMARGERVHVVIIRLVDQAVLLVDTTRPVTGQLSPKSFGLARSVERIPRGRFDKPKRAECHPAVSPRQ